MLLLVYIYNVQHTTGGHLYSVFNKHYNDPMVMNFCHRLGHILVN